MERKGPELLVLLHRCHSHQHCHCITGIYYPFTMVQKEYTFLQVIIVFLFLLYHYCLLGLRVFYITVMIAMYVAGTVIHS